MKCTNKNEQPVGYTAREWARIQQKEAQEAKRQRKLILVLLLLFLLTALMGFLVYYFVFRSHDYELFSPYDRTDPVLSSGGSLLTGNTADAFAADLCVASGDVNSAALTLNAYSAGLFDVNHERTVYAKDIFTKRSPASITKVMTALVALKYGNLDGHFDGGGYRVWIFCLRHQRGRSLFPAAAALWYDARFRKRCGDDDRGACGGIGRSFC